MKPYHIKSEFACLVEQGTECEKLLPNQYLLANAGEVIKVYPLTSVDDCYSLCYSLTVGEDDYETVELKNYKILYLKQRLVARQSNILCQKSDSNFKAKLFSFPHSFIIENGEKAFTYNIDKRLDSYEIKFNSTYIILIASTVKKDYCLLFNKKTNEITDFYAETIELKDNSLKVLKIEKDIAKHAISVMYELDSNEISEKEYTLYYSKKQPVVTSVQQIMPIAFLQAIKLRDYNLARFYITETLSKRLDDKHLKAFFGEIKSVLVSTDPIIVDCNNNAKEFKFVYDDDKISNIIPLD